jgi:phosphoglycolate phosphatase
VSPARFLFVGDSTHDLKAARAAGCPAVAVTYGYPDDLPALVSGADAVVGRLEECLGLLAWREASGTGRVVW